MNAAWEVSRPDLAPGFDSYTTCTCCGIRFQESQPSYQLYRDCWRWCRIGQYVEETSRLLGEVAP